MWPGSAACHQPPLSLLCFSFYQQLLRRHSAAVANESSDLLPAFSHPLSQPGSPFWLSLSSLSLSLPPPLFVCLHGIFFHILSYLPLPPCLRVCSGPASFCYTTFRHSLPLSSALLFFFFSISPQSSQGLSGKASDTCCNSRSLDKTATEETFRPQSEIVDNRRLHPAGQQSIFQRNTCAHEFV